MLKIFGIKNVDKQYMVFCDCSEDEKVQDIVLCKLLVEIFSTVDKNNVTFYTVLYKSRFSYQAWS